jgi:hypothetical protein
LDVLNETFNFSKKIRVRTSILRILLFAIEWYQILQRSRGLVELGNNLLVDIGKARLLPSFQVRSFSGSCKNSKQGSG